MTAMRVTQQIQHLVDSDDIDTKAAVVLLLSAHAELIDKQDAIMDRLDEISLALTAHTKCVDDELKELKRRVAELEAYQKEHPSLLWLARFRPKQTVAIALAIVVVVVLLLTSSARQPLLDLLASLF